MYHYIPLDNLRKSHPIRDAWIEIAWRDLATHCAQRSHPIRDAWIEISSVTLTDKWLLSHPIRDAWIEIESGLSCAWRGWSHPIRDAWIEISVLLVLDAVVLLVASHTGCVD